MADTPEQGPQPPTVQPQPDTVDLPPGGDAHDAATLGLQGPPPPDEPAPRFVGGYELLAELGRGGMGVVHRAREPHSGRLVALKMMLGQGCDATDLQRFILEARATGELTHPGVVTIHAWGEHAGHPYYTMDLVPGVALGKLLQEGPLPPDKAVRYLTGMARAVASAHALGIVHRDLKPGNVIIDLSDQPRVLDFGLAKRHRPVRERRPGRDEILEVLPVADGPAALAHPVAHSGRLTEKGAILGTPAYMAPEQVRAEHDQVGPPADVHALGAIFHEMLTGKPPFQASSTYDTLIQVLERQPAPVRSLNARVPAALEEVCLRCLEKHAEDRYADAGALADDLERRWHRSQRAARFARLAATAAAALVLLQLVRLVAVNGLHLDLARVADGLGAWAHAGAGLRATVSVVAGLLDAILLVAAPLLAAAGLLLWLGAWVWHSDHPWRLVAACGAVAAAGLALAFVPGFEFLQEPPLALAFLLSGEALVVLAVAAYRFATAADRAEANARAPTADPYLQKLFAVRSDAHPKRRRGDSGTRRLGEKANAPDSAAAASPDPRVAVSPQGLDDLELSKTLYRGDAVEVRWARQKSLDRPVLVWFERTPAGGTALPGVVVRHPGVLGLHAVGSGPEGRFLITEPVPASALAEVVEQRGLVPLEAAALTATLARAVQAFHDQGACHGRLGPEWVLVRGDLEPVLCPCGVPSPSADDRAADVRALGRLLLGWLPPPPRWWQGKVLVPLYQVAEAAVAGRYARAADLAADLDTAARAVRVLWRQRWANVFVLALLALPLATWGLDTTAGVRAEWVLLALLPSTVLLGFAHGRTLVQGLRLRRRTMLRDPFLGRAALLGLVQAVGFFLLAGALALSGLAQAGGGVFGNLLLLPVEFGGFWLLGACGAGLVTFVELLWQSLQREPAAA